MTTLQQATPSTSARENTGDVQDASRQRTRICYVIASIHTDRAGTEGHLLRLIRGLDSDRFDPLLVVLQRSDWTDGFDDPQVPMQVLGFQSFKRLRDWRCIRQLVGILRRHRADVVELHFTDAHFAGALAARWAGTPVVISCRRDLGHQYGRKELALAKTANPLITRFLANSQEVASTISRLEGIDSKRLHVIPNGIDLQRFDEQTKLDVDPEFENRIRGKQVVAIAANLRPIKNLQGFLTAARQIADRRDDVAFVVMGAGPQRESLQARAAELHLSDQFLWTGSVPATAPYLSRSHVGCLTSDAEGFSNSIVEYMAARLPVVATRVGAAPEAIVESETGYLVGAGGFDDLAHKVLQLLANTTLRRNLGDAGRQRVEQRFTHQVQMRAYEDFYSQLLQARTTSGHRKR